MRLFYWSTQRDAMMNTIGYVGTELACSDTVVPAPARPLSERWERR